MSGSCLPAACTVFFVSHNDHQICAITATFICGKWVGDFGAFHSEPRTGDSQD